MLSILFIVYYNKRSKCRYHIILTDQLNKFRVHVCFPSSQFYVRWVPLTAIQIRLLCRVCCGNDNSCDCLKSVLFTLCMSYLPQLGLSVFTLLLKFYCVILYHSPCFPSNKTAIMSEDWTSLVYISIQTSFIFYYLVYLLQYDKAARNPNADTIIDLFLTFHRHLYYFTIFRESLQAASWWVLS